MAEGGRTIGAHAIIAAGLIVGAQMLIVAPAQEEASSKTAEVAHLRAQVASVSDVSNAETRLEQRRQSADDALARIEEQNAFAQPARLVGLVQRLAGASGVTVDRIDPETLEPRSGLREGDRRASTMPTSGVGFVIDAGGTYESVARFVASIESRPGFVRTDGITLRPSTRPGEDMVRVTIRTTQLAFDPDGFALATTTTGGTGS